MANKSVKSLFILGSYSLALVFVMTACQAGKDWDGGSTAAAPVNTQGTTVDATKVCPPGVDCVNQTTDTTDYKTACNSTTTATSLYSLWTQSRTYSDTHTETTYLQFSKDTSGSMLTLSVSTICKGSGDPVTATASSKIRVSTQSVVVEQITEDDTKYTLPNNVAGVCKAWTTPMMINYSFQGTCLMLSNNVFTVNPEFFIPAQQ